MALATSAGWQATNKTFYHTSGDEPCRVPLPDVGLQAEHWTSLLAVDSPTKHQGACLHLSTDRVKFHRLDPNAHFGRDVETPLVEVPARVFSEVMRD